MWLSIIYWKAILSPMHCIKTLVKTKLLGYRFMVLLLGTLLVTRLSFCIYTNAMVFSLLHLCYILWNQIIYCYLFCLFGFFLHNRDNFAGTQFTRSDYMWLLIGITWVFLKQVYCVKNSFHRYQIKMSTAPPAGDIFFQ
jgi:hypothetical protein